MQNFDYTVLIRDALTVKQALEYYGIQFNQRGFALCPFHSEKTPSFKVQNEQYWHCFGCLANGDIMKFVMDYFNLNWRDTIDKINKDFTLNLPIGRRVTLGESMESSRHIREINAERERKRAESETVEAAYREILDEYLRLDYNLIHFKPPVPSPPDIELNPLFVEAISNVEYYKWLLKITPQPERR